MSTHLLRVNSKYSVCVCFTAFVCLFFGLCLFVCLFFFFFCYCYPTNNPEAARGWAAIIYGKQLTWYIYPFTYCKIQKAKLANIIIAGNYLLSKFAVHIFPYCRERLVSYCVLFCFVFSLICKRKNVWYNQSSTLRTHW